MRESRAAAHRCPSRRRSRAWCRCRTRTPDRTLSRLARSCAACCRGPRRSLSEPHRGSSRTERAGRRAGSLAWRWLSCRCRLLQSFLDVVTMALQMDDARHGEVQLQTLRSGAPEELVCSERADRGHHSRMCFEPSLPAVGHGSLPPRLMRRRVLLVGREGYPDKSARSPLVGRPALPRDLLGDAAGELLPPRQVRDHVADPPPWAFAEDGPVEVAIIERSQPLVEVMPFTLERTDRGPLVRRRNVDRWVAHVARSGPQRAQR